MNKELALDSEILSDASLVEHSQAGDRDAFGQIVARYQSPICALAYSACGNVSRSEDIAQEIFLTAWRRLGSLSEPDKFKAWLYGIARNLINNTFRQQSRNPVANADCLEEAAEPATDACEPDVQAISREEETILWHVLSGLPQTYREPMVLFYRQNESIPEVAEAMAISEEAVRQRLSRGRALLNERVVKVIQNGLRLSGPKDAFAVTVIASLPLLAAATTTKGAVIGMAVTKSASSQAGGITGFLKSFSLLGIFAIPAIVGTCFGYKLGQDAAGRPQQRKSARKFWRFFACGLAFFLALPLLLTFGITGFLHNEARAQFLSIMTRWLGLAYLFVPVSLAFWVWLRRRKQPDSVSCLAPDESEPARRPLGEIQTGSARKISRRLVLILTATAAGLLVFCYTDTHHNVKNLTTDEFQSLVTQSAPDELEISIMEGHEHSFWREYPKMYRYLWVEVLKDGKPTTYYAGNVDDPTLAAIAKKGVDCKTYIAGRDYEVLGTPGRMLPFLASFVLAIGGINLIKRWKEKPVP